MNVEFNHFYITLDDNTLESINESVFLEKEFCRLERLSVQADEDSWSGSYLLGKQSYLEFFAPGGATGLTEGMAGIGFSTTRISQIDNIEERLEKLAPGKSERGLRVRKTDDEEVRWFHWLGLKNPEENGFYAWLMEFHPDYLRKKDIDLSESGLIDRGTLLIPNEKKAHQLPLLDDIYELRLDISASEHETLAILLQAFGYESSRNGDITIYRSNRFELKVSESENPGYRICEAKCSLTSKYQEKKSISFGNKARISMGRDSALWQFG